MALPAMLRDLGADADAVIATAGLGPEILADPENVIPFLTLGHLFEQAARATHRDHIGHAPWPDILDAIARLSRPARREFADCADRAR